jgi:thymidylate synthase (FAD)
MTINVITPSVKVINLQDPMFNKWDIGNVSSTEILSEYVGRTCYNSYDKLTDISYLKFNAGAAKKAHRSIFEFNNICISIQDLVHNEYIDICSLLDECKYIEYDIVENSDISYIINIFGSFRSYIEILEKFINSEFLHVPNIRLFNSIYWALQDDSPNIFTNWSSYNEIDSYHILMKPDEIYATTYTNITTLLGGYNRYKKILVEVISDRGLHNEMVRHRPCSFMAESQRYVRYGIDTINEFSICVATEHINDDIYIENVKKSSEASFNTYLKLLEAGYAPQLSRAVLPIGTSIRYFIYATLAEWHHIFRLRTSKMALPMAQEVVKEIRNQFINKQLL